MHRLYWFDTDDDARPPEELWEEGDRRFFKIRRKGPDGADRERIVVFLDPDRTTPGNIRRLLHEFSLREFLGGAWALQPLELVQDRELTMLVLEYHDGRPLDRLMGLPMETGLLLRLGVALLAAVRQMHERGLVHKDLKPNNVLVTPARRSSADRIRHCLAAAARAPGTGPSRGHCRHAALHGTGADRPDEPVDRLA